ncbi:MAG: hypothetical protein R3F59_06450 [Myxococcota bacterium]
MTFRLATLLTLVGCGYGAPKCEDLRFSPISFDLSAADPVFSWEGDDAQGFAVVDAQGIARWELVCSCPGGDCQSADDWDARACLRPPISYGVVPDSPRIQTAGDFQLTPLPLDPGDVYTAIAWSECEQDGRPQRVVSADDFTAP